MTANFSMQSVFSGDVESQNVTGVLVKRKEFALHQQQLQTLITDQPHSRTSSATLKRHKKVSQQQFTIKSQPDVAAIDACMQTNVVQIVTTEDVKPDVKVTSITKYKSPKQVQLTPHILVQNNKSIREVYHLQDRQGYRGIQKSKSEELLTYNTLTQIQI